MENESEYGRDSLAKWNIYPIHCFDEDRLASEAEMKSLCEDLSRAAIDQLCVDEGRVRLRYFQQRRRPSIRKATSEAGMSHLIGEVTEEVREDTIDSASQLDYHLGDVSDWKSRQTIAYYFDARNSWSRLQITEEIIRKILATYLVQPKLIPILLTFGEKINATEESYISYFDKIQDLSPFGNTDLNVFADLNGYEIGYNIKYVARHNRDRPKDPFMVRQTGVYQKFDPHENRSIWILIQAAPDLKERFRYLLEKSNKTPEDVALQVEIHLAILTYYGENWRPYIAYLESFAEGLTDKGFYSQPIARPETESIQVETSDVRELHFLSDKLRRLLQLIDLDIHLAQKLLKFVRRLTLVLSNAATSERVNPRLEELLVGIKEHIFSLEISKSRITALLDRTRDISTLIRQVLDFRNEELNRSMSSNLQQLAAASVKENQNMASIAEKSAKDTKMMKLITIITAIFLPATFVASVFGTNFFNYDNDSQRIVVAKNLWVYFVIASGITSSIFITWLLWKIRFRKGLFQGIDRFLSRFRSSPPRLDEEKYASPPIILIPPPFPPLTSTNNYIKNSTSNNSTTVYPINTKIQNTQ